MSLHLFRCVAIACCSMILGAAGLFAETKATYLQVFPTISADSSGIYFQGREWTALWKKELGRPACVPPSLVNPPPVDRGRVALYNGDHFFVSGDTLHWETGVVSGKSFVLPDPTDEALRELRTAGNLKPRATLSLVEEMGPITAASNRIWFGLVLSDELSGSAVSGVGWFDLQTEKFVRLYSAAIGERRPQWITDIGDSLLILYSPMAQDDESRLYLYQISSGEFFEAELSRMGVTGEEILGAYRSGDSIFFSTDYGITLWQPGKTTLNFATLSVASPAPVGLSLRTFEPESEVPFDTLPAGVSTRIWWQEGEWIEVAVPRPIRGFVDADSWAKFGEIWQKRYWDCGEEECVARVEFPVAGRLQAADFIHTPLTYLGTEPEGLKVGVNAAWVRSSDVAPVFVQTQLQQ
jgi:hypothetical protein